MGDILQVHPAERHNDSWIRVNKEIRKIRFSNYKRLYLVINEKQSKNFTVWMNNPAL